MKHYAIETVAVATQGAKGFRRTFTAAASLGAAKWRVAEQQERGFPARWFEVSAAEHAAILRGEWNDFVPESRIA